jgi:hypothetical protein
VVLTVREARLGAAPPVDALIASKQTVAKSAAAVKQFRTVSPQVRRL